MGDDGELEAHVFGSLSHLANYNHQPEQAIVYARDGQQLASGRAPTGVAARLLALEARGYAAVGDAERCADHIRRAEKALSGQPRVPQSPWVSQFDDASLAAEAARCFQQLRQHDEARRQAEHVVATRPHERARSRALAQLTLISLLLTQRKRDEACGLAHQVLPATQSLGSFIVLRKLEQLAGLFRPYARSREVAALLDQLNAELPERRRMVRQLAPASDMNGVTTP